MKGANLIRNSFYVLVGMAVLAVSGIVLIGAVFGTDETGNEDIMNVEEVLSEEIVRNEENAGEQEAKKQEVTEIGNLAKEYKESNTDIVVTANTSSSVQTPTPTPEPTPEPRTPVTGSCPASTLKCVPCNISDGHWACRVEPGETEGFLGWACQNNNPGNIRYSDARVSYIAAHGGPKPCGERFDSRGGTYMIFGTYSAGRTALKAYMKAINAGTHTAYSQCATPAGCSLSYVFSKYAPGDPNYAKNIADKIGVKATTKLDWVIKKKFEALISAIQSKEGFFVQ